MKTINWEEIIKSCPWRFVSALSFCGPQCSAQPNGCTPGNCAVFHFIEIINRPIYAASTELEVRSKDAEIDACQKYF